MMQVMPLTKGTDAPLKSQTTAATGRTILALDLGTATGWAIRGFDGLITSGTASFRPGRFDGGGMRYLRISNWLGEIDRLSGPLSDIWFQDEEGLGPGWGRASPTNAATRHRCCPCPWRVDGDPDRLGRTARRPCQGVPVGTIKRHAPARAPSPRRRRRCCGCAGWSHRRQGWSGCGRTGPPGNRSAGSSASAVPRQTGGGNMGSASSPGG